MADCIFCKIVKGEIPCHKVYEDEEALAFLDVKPAAKGHTLVIPKAHAQNLSELSDEQAKGLMLAVKKTMQRIQEKLAPDGFNVGWNQEGIAGQVVMHLHIHIFPRYFNDGGGSVHSIIKNPGDKSVEEIAELFK